MVDSLSAELASVPRRTFNYALNAGSSDLRVNGSVTSVSFNITPDATYETYFTQLRFFGGGNGIQFTKFLSKTGALTNGILVEIKTDNITFQFEPLKKTEDFKNIFADSANNFSVDVQSGADQFIAVFGTFFPIRLQPQGTYGTDDYIKVTIRDDLSSGLTQLQFFGMGYKT